jgi:hypothetical protein
MKKKCFDWESVFAHIWGSADREGLWTGNATTLAAEFGVQVDEAHEVLGGLADRSLIEKLAPAKFIITEWRERDDG